MKRLKVNTKRLHYFSGITISIFICLHLFNHACSLLGADAHIEMMTTLRRGYGNVLVEPILFFVVFIQVVSGIKLFLKKRKSVSTYFEKLQIWSGLYLAVFLAFHSTAILAGRYVLNLDTNFYFGVAGLNTFPTILFFFPYYSFAIVSFFGHISAVHSMKMKHTICGVSAANQAHVILAIGVICAVVIMYGLTNGFRGVEIPIEYAF